MKYCLAFLYILKTNRNEKKLETRLRSLRKWVCTAAPAM